MLGGNGLLSGHNGLLLFSDDSLCIDILFLLIDEDLSLLELGLIRLQFCTHFINFNLSFFEHFKTSDEAISGLSVSKTLLTKDLLVRGQQLEVTCRSDVRDATIDLTVLVDIFLDRLMDILEHLNAALLVLFKLHVTIGNVALGDVDEGLRRPSCEPINRAAVDERRELSQSCSENLTKG